MRAQLFRKISAGCIVVAFFTATAFAQRGQPPQGGQTPQPQPNPQPQPRQPNPTPQPTNPSQNLTIRGRIITGVHADLNIVEVRIETEGGQPVGFAYTDSGGEFRFQRSGINLDQQLFVIVNVDGYKPYRERLFGGFGASSFDGFVTIFLERADGTGTAKKDAGAIVDLKQLRAKIPGKAVDEYEKALKESSKGNREKAVEGLQRAVKLAPDFYEAQNTLGIQYLVLQKYDEAETALLRARDLSPKSGEPLLNLGTLYYQRGESQIDAGRSEEAASTFQKAVDVLEESIRRNPLSAAANSYLGAALYKIGSYDRAETVLNHSLELDADQQNARLMLVNVYTKMARYTDALQQANIFIEKNPKAPQRPALENIKQQLEKVLAKQN